MVLDFVVNMVIVIMVVSLFNITRYILKIRKVMKMYKDNPNVQGIRIVNGKINIIEKNEDFTNSQVEPVKDIVNDSICGKELEKKDAYRVVKEGKEYFFCSWECRENFLKDSTI